MSIGGAQLPRSSEAPTPERPLAVEEREAGVRARLDKLEEGVEHSADLFDVVPRTAIDPERIELVEEM